MLKLVSQTRQQRLPEPHFYPGDHLVAGCFAAATLSLVHPSAGFPLSLSLVFFDVYVVFSISWRCSICNKHTLKRPDAFLFSLI